MLESLTIDQVQSGALIAIALVFVWLVFKMAKLAKVVKQMDEAFEEMAGK